MRISPWLDNQTITKLVVRFGPAVLLLPLLSAPLPNIGHTKLEIRGYFQSLAFVRLGFQSYFVVTPEESWTALHLHSLLSSPFVAIGIPEGGRVVSLLMALIGVAVIALLGRELFGDQVALLVPAVLWAHPFFVRFASRYYSHTTSIALTGGAIAAMLYYIKVNDRWWFAISLLLVSLGIINHMWEATILLPLTALLVAERRIIPSIITPVVGISTVAFVSYVTKFQTEGVVTKGTGMHSVIYYPDLLFTPAWWIGGSFSLHPIELAQPFTLLLSIVFAGYFSWRWIQTRTRQSLLMSSWLASGLFIPVFLPRVIVGQYYALWALLPPLSLAIAYTIHVLLSWVKPRLNFERNQLSQHISILIIVVAITNILLIEFGFATVFALGLTPSYGAPIPGLKQGEALQAGEELASMEDLQVADIVFVGDWGYTNANMNERGYTRELARVLIYSDLLITGKTPDESELRFYENVTNITNCEVIVERNRNQINVKKC